MGFGDFLGGAATFVGDMMTGGAISNSNDVQQTNANNVEHSREQMAFQERMSGSAYQRAMADMGKAGLNPMLAFSQGGASTPSGAMATEQSPNRGNIAGNLAEKIKQGIGMQADIKKTNADTNLSSKNAEVAETNVQLNNARVENTSASSSQIREQTRKARKETEKLTHETKRAEAEADTARMRRDIQKGSFDADKNLAPVRPYLDTLTDAVGVGGSAVKIFRGAPRRPQIRTKSEDQRLEEAGDRGIPVDDNE